MIGKVLFRLAFDYALRVIKIILREIARPLTDQYPNQYPDLVRHLYVPARLLGTLGLNAGVPLLSHTDYLKCFICKNGIEDAGHIFFVCVLFRENFNIFWYKLKTTLFNANPLGSNFIFSFVENLDRKHKTMFLLGGYFYHLTVKQLLS